MINIYTSKEKLGREVNVIDYNDVFFGLNPPELDQRDWDIIRKIDGAVQVEGITIRTTYGLCNIFDLSTGCKTVLNVIHNPSIIFDITDCGNNAILVLFNEIRNLDITVMLRHTFVKWEEKIPMKINGGKVITDSFDLSCEISDDGY